MLTDLIQTLTQGYLISDLDRVNSFFNLIQPYFKHLNTDTLIHLLNIYNYNNNE